MCAVSLEDSLWILYKYVRDSADKEELSLDHVLVPMIEHVCMISCYLRIMQNIV